MEEALLPLVRRYGFLDILVTRQFIRIRLNAQHLLAPNGVLAIGAENDGVLDNDSEDSDVPDTDTGNNDVLDHDTENNGVLDNDPENDRVLDINIIGDGGTPESNDSDPHFIINIIDSNNDDLSAGQYYALMVVDFLSCAVGILMFMVTGYQVTRLWVPLVFAPLVLSLVAPLVVPPVVVLSLPLVCFSVGVPLVVALYAGYYTSRAARAVLGTAVNIIIRLNRILSDFIDLC